MMKSNSVQCDASRLGRFLAEELSPREEANLEQHLNDCEACRDALEELAGRPDDWREARDLLGGDGHTAGPSAAEEPADVDAVLAALSPSDDPRMLGRLGGYEIAGVIGRGGMGVVLKGFDPALNRYVAIKVLAPHLAGGAARKRFAREAQAAAAVVHENVVAIHAVAADGPLPFFVMPYIRGASLQKRLDGHGPLQVAEVLRVAVQISSGLAAAHAQGLVHRDIKPANILLDEGVERLKITDFGLARAADDASLTRTGVIAGTPQFMSPEQAKGEPVDARSDLFSLGSLMYAACTGRPPFRAETSYGVLRRIVESQPPPVSDINPQAPPWLAAIIQKLHAKDPAARFSSAEEAARLLKQCLAHVQQPAAVPLPETCRPPQRQSVKDIVVNALGQLWATKRGRFASIAAGVLVVAGALIANGPPPPDDKASPAEPPPAHTAAAPGWDESHVDPSAWRDGATEDLLELNNDATTLETRAERLW